MLQSVQCNIRRAKGEGGEGKSLGTRNTVSGFMSHKMEIFLAMRTRIVGWFYGVFRVNTDFILQTKGFEMGKTFLGKLNTVSILC